MQEITLQINTLTAGNKNDNKCNRRRQKENDDMIIVIIIIIITHFLSHNKRPCWKLFVIIWDVCISFSLFI